MTSAASNMKSSAARAADSKPLEILVRAGFIGYGVIHLLIAWIALQVAFSGASQSSDQSGALQKLAEGSFGKTLVIAVVVGMVALALWQLSLAVLGHGKPAERALNAGRAVLYLYFAYLGYKVIKGAGSQADSQEKAASGLMANTGGRWLVALAGLVVLGIGIGLIVYGWRKKFEKHLNTAAMNAQVHRTVRRLGMAGYIAKGVAYGTAGALIVAAAVTYDPDKARGLDAALKTLAGQSYGPWLLAVVALGIAAYGVYCFFQAKYRKV